MFDEKQLTARLEDRRISRNAANGSAIEQSVQVITTVSTALSARGIDGRRPLQEFGADTGCGSASAPDRERASPPQARAFVLRVLQLKRTIG